MSKVIGILGGMGPLATVAFEETLLRTSQAKCDSEYPILITLNDGTMPDRTKAIFHGGQSPVPKMCEGIQRLRSMGAEVICMPCNTAHVFANELTEALVGVTFVNIVEAVCDLIKDCHSDAQNIGMLGTTGTRAGGHYDRMLAQAGMQIIYPNPQQQDLIMNAIYGERGVKSGHIDEPRAQLELIVDHLRELGANVAILGCTELPLALKQASLPLIDSNEALAIAVLKAARE